MEEKEKEIEIEMKEMAKGPVAGVCNFPHLIIKCAKLGVEVPEKAWDIFVASSNKLANAYKILMELKEELNEIKEEK